jgi:hypothetical protein
MCLVGIVVRRRRKRTMHPVLGRMDSRYRAGRSLIAVSGRTLIAMFGSK